MDLDKPEMLSGMVTQFKGNGRKLGYPTANLTTETDLNDGVYFGFADLGQWSSHPAIIFVGVPTTMGDTERRVETYLLDIPDDDYYGLLLRVSIEHYHRANQKFDGIDELVEVMNQDESAAREWFAS